jgi:hypothetical protein
MKHRTIRFMTTATALVLLFSFSTISLAQSDTAQVDRDALAVVYEASARVPTNIHGVSTFATPPGDFNPLSASDAELATYGFPPRPDSEADPDAHAQWVRAMRAAKNRWNGALRDMGAYSTGAKIVQHQSNLASPDVPTPARTYNWSGIVNTNKLATWNKNTSVYFVVSSFNVPVVQPPFGTCDGGYDWEVSWNGIDGFFSGDVLQGGSSSQVFCSGGAVSTNYCGWVEWYPSYPILCEFGVNPGDDMYVESYSPSGGTNEGFVFIEDETTLTYGTYGLNYITGPPLVGNSAEYIVERPCCRGNNNYPLANYIWNFWAGSYGYNFYNYNHGLPTQYYPGSAATTTYIVSMVDDANDQVISVPAAQGKNGVFFYDTGCAYTGGCTP